MERGKYIRTQDVRLKNKNAMLGKKHSIETRKKLSEARRKRKDKPMLGKHHSIETKHKMRKSHLGKPATWRKGVPTSDYQKLIASITHKGRKWSEESKKKLSESLKKLPYKPRPNIQGKNHPNWKGGIKSIHRKIRASEEYKQWREAVFRRDNWTCKICGIRNKKGLGKKIKLEADHIKPFCNYPELRFDINNGRTLCIECHRKTDTWGNRVKTKKYD